NERVEDRIRGKRDNEGLSWGNDWREGKYATESILGPGPEGVLHDGIENTSNTERWLDDVWHIRPCVLDLLLLRDSEQFRGQLDISKRRNIDFERSTLELLCELLELCLIKGKQGF